jgi:outer membrane protein assembly factor BamA
MTDEQKATLTQMERLLANAAGLQWLGSARPTIALDMRDDKFNPHKGLLVNLGFEYTRSLTAPKKGEVNFIKTNATATFYIPTSRKTTLALQVGGGDIATIGSTGSATPDAVFYLGGRSTLRGFADKAVWAADASETAKHDKEGAVTLSSGGNAYVLYKAEFRFPISGGFEGGLFVDAGNLWVDYASFSPYKLRPCAGFGIRYKTPVGPLSLDFGINLLPDETVSESAGAWSFSVGMF